MTSARTLALCLLLLAAPALADGDTYSVRLAGLDAPESDQPCPVDAAGRLKALLPDIAVCRQVGMSWGRPVQQCTLHDGRDLGGHVVGIADIVDCVSQSNNPWFMGHYGFVLENARPIDPISLKAQLGLFPAPPEVLRQVHQAA